MKTSVFPYLTSALIALLFVASLFIQSAADWGMMLPSLTLSCVLILSTRLNRLDYRDAGLLLLLPFWAWMTFTGILSDVPFSSKVTWVIFSVLPLTYLATRLMPSAPFSFLSLLPWLCLPLAGYSIYEWLNGVTRPQFPFEDANLLGLLFACSFLAALPLINQSRGRVRFWGFLVLLMIFLFATFLTQSRSAVFGLLIVSSLWFFLQKSVAPRSRQIAYGLIVACIFVCFAYATGLYHRLDLVSGGHIDASLMSRLTIIKSSLHMISIHPWTGYGLGTFHLFYPAFRNAGDDSAGMMVHMDFLHMAVECGLLGMVFLYAVFIGVFVIAYKKRHALSAAQQSALAIVTLIFIVMHVNYPFHALPFLMILGSGMAILLPVADKNSPRLSALSICVLVTLLSLVFVGARSTMTFLLHKEVVTAHALGDTPRFSKALEACYQDGDTYFADCYLMGAKSLIFAHDTDKDFIEHLLISAETANPASPEPDYLRAQQRLIDDPHDVAVVQDYLYKSLTKNPQYWAARRLLIQTLQKNGQTATSQRVFKDGLIYPYARPVVDDISRMKKELYP